MKKVKIYTIVDKTTCFIPWQTKSFKDYLKDDYEFIIVNNSTSDKIDTDIKNHCEAQGLKYIDVEHKDYGAVAFAHSAAAQEIINKYISKDRDCINVILDSDIVLMRDFSFKDYVKGYDFAIISQARRASDTFIFEYAWIGFLVINTTAPNMDKFLIYPGTLNHGGADVGFGTFFYFLYNDVKCRRIPCTGILEHPDHIANIPEPYKSQYEIKYQSEIIEGGFFHARGMSRWDKMSDRLFEAKCNFVRKLVEKS